MQTETMLDNSQIQIINNSIELFKSAPEVLKANQLRTSKAKSVGESIIQQWKDAFAITDEDARLQALSEVDARSNKYLANCATALQDEKDARASITQMMDAFKKMFTEAESELDKSKAGTVTYQIQNNRNLYATEASKIQERKRKEADRLAAQAKELIEIRTAFEQSYVNAFGEFLVSKKTKLQQMFNNLRLEQFADDAVQIRTIKPQFSQSHFDCLIADPIRWAKYHSPEEVISLGLEVKASLFDRFSMAYGNDMLALKSELVDKIPSKHEELKEKKRMDDEAAAEKERQRVAEEKRQAEIAKANAAEKERLEEKAKAERLKEQQRLEQMEREQKQADAARKARELEEAEKIQAAADDAKRKAEQELEIKKQGEQTMVLFEQEAAMAEVSHAPETRKGYDIAITHPVAYTQIFALWFENEGKNLSVEKIGNTKLDQMKAWAEKFALKTGTKIESKFLHYEDSFKAVNRKVK